MCTIWVSDWMRSPPNHIIVTIRCFRQAIGFHGSLEKTKIAQKIAYGYFKAFGQ